MRRAKRAVVRAAEAYFWHGGSDPSYHEALMDAVRDLHTEQDLRTDRKRLKAARPIRDKG